MMLERVLAICAEGMRRLRTGYRQTLGFTAIGTATERLVEAPVWLAQMQHLPWEAFAADFMLDTLACAVAALFISAGFRLCTPSGSALLRRPARFLLLLVSGASAATVLTWSVRSLLAGAAPPVQVDLLVNFWMETMRWGGLLGWLYLLALQRTEDHARFTHMLTGRALLARQLAHARLGTARARIDPAMVARVLAKVHQRYHHQPVQAALLLDCLVSYLRLAINRGRAGTTGFPAELAMIRALVTLRSCEHEMAISCRSFVDDGAGLRCGSVFEAASDLLNKALGDGAASIELQLRAADGAVRVEVVTDIVPTVQRRSYDAITQACK